MIGGVAGEGLGRAVDCAAALLLALAVGLAAAMSLADAEPALRIAATASAAIIVFAVTLRVLRIVEAPPFFRLRPFDVQAMSAHVEVGDLWPEELLLTDQVEPGSEPGDELLLDDVLPDIGAGSRVVRLFELPISPTTRVASPAGADATEDLVAALEALRRSLR